MRNEMGRWSRGEQGNVAVMFALMLPLVFGGAAFGMETTYWYLTRLQLQSAADAAALAGAMDKRQGLDTQAIIASATKSATDNGYVPSKSTITVNTPPATGTSGNQAVEVILQTTAQRFFTAIYSTTSVKVKARAVAKYRDAGNACVLALNKTASGAANFQGSTALTLNSCSVMANSLSSSAINVQGAAQLTTECLIAVGGVSATSGAHTTCAAPITGASPVADPFANVPAPTSGSCQASNGNNLSPGTYCNGLNLSGNKTLAPGVYVIDGGTFRINSNANVTGTGVTFYLKNGADIKFNGNADINFSAPTSGAYAGMVFYGERTNTATQQFNGTATSHITGNIYFKGGSVLYNGNFSGINGCTQVVADTVDWTGNSTFGINCAAYGMSAIPAIYTVRLSE